MNALSLTFVTTGVPFVDVVTRIACWRDEAGATTAAFCDVDVVTERRREAEVAGCVTGCVTPDAGVLTARRRAPPVDAIAVFVTDAVVLVLERRAAS